MKITISIDEREKKILNKRAKKNLLSLREQIEDIVRRSCVRSGKSVSSFKIDDKLVAAFSRDKRGRKKKKKVKKKKK